MLGLDPSIHGSAFSPLRHGPPGQARGRQSEFGPLPPALRGERDKTIARSTGSRRAASRASSGRRASAAGRTSSPADPKSVVWGNSGAVRVDPVGRLFIKTKTKKHY